VNCSQWQEWQDVGYVTDFMLPYMENSLPDTEIGHRRRHRHAGRHDHYPLAVIGVYFCGFAHKFIENRSLVHKKVHPMCPNRSSHMFQLLVLAWKRHVPAFSTQIT